MILYNEITMIPLEQITPYENNPRDNEAAITALMKAITEIGFNVPLVVDKNYVIVKGHSRYEAAKRLGMTELPCIITQASAEQVAQDRLLDNKLSELSSWDLNKLSFEVREIDMNMPEIGLSMRARTIPQASVSEQQIERAQAMLIDDRGTAQEKRKYVELRCPECGEEFYIDADEVQRYR